MNQIGSQIQPILICLGITLCYNSFSSSVKHNTCPLKMYHKQCFIISLVHVIEKKNYLRPYREYLMLLLKVERPFL